MFNRTVSPADEALEEAITAAISYLEYNKPGEPEYDLTLDKLERLYKLRAPHPEARKPVSRDALVQGAFSIAGILLVLNYERAHIVTSKAFSFIKLK
jgi:hypothetical protein